MDNALQQSFKQWDRQEEVRITKRDQDQAFIKLNNLFLRIERGAEALTIHTANTLRVLVSQAYDRDDTERHTYWLNEFLKLDGWLEV